MAADPLLVLEYCACCGHSVPSLVEETGWCPQCTVNQNPTLNVCTSCGAVHKKSGHNLKCKVCRKEDWYLKHADRLEGYISTGRSLSQAIEAVRNDIRPRCNNCGNSMSRAKEDSNFCGKRSECRRVARSFTTLRASGLSHDVSLAIALGRVTVFS